MENVTKREIVLSFLIVITVLFFIIRDNKRMIDERDQIIEEKDKEIAHYRDTIQAITSDYHNKIYKLDSITRTVEFELYRNEKIQENLSKNEEMLANSTFQELAEMYFKGESLGGGH